MPEELKNLGQFRDPEQMHQEYIDAVTLKDPALFDEKALKEDFDGIFGVRYVKAGEYQKKELVSLKPVGINKPTDVADNDRVIIQYAGKDVGYFENNDKGKQKLYDFLSYTVDKYLKEGERAQLYKTIADELATASIEYEASKLERSIANLQPGRESPAAINTRRKDSKNAEKDINSQNDAMANLLTQQLATLQEQFNLLNQKHDDLENTQLQTQMNVLLDRVVKLRQALSLAKYSKKGSPEVVMITYNLDGTTVEQTADQVDAEIKSLQTQIDEVAKQINQNNTGGATVPGSKGGSPSAPAAAPTATPTAPLNAPAATPSAPATAPSAAPAAPSAPSSVPLNAPTAGPTTPQYDVFKFEFWDGSESARSYLTRSGIPESHLNRFQDSDRRDMNNLNDAVKKLDEFKSIAMEIQAIYLANPSFDIPPSDVTTNPKAVDKAYRQIAKLYQKLEKTDAEIATELSKKIKGDVFSYHLLNDKDKNWSDVLMGKKKDIYTWSRFSPDYGRDAIYPGTNTFDLGRTQGASKENNEKVALGKEGLVTRELLMNAPLRDLILKANTLAAGDASIEAQTIRLAMLEKIIKAGSTAPERNPDGSIRNVPMEEMLTMLGNGNKELGHNKYRELIRAVMMTEKFQQDLNVNYTNSLKVTKSMSAEKLQANKTLYLNDHFQFPDPTQEDALLLNAFVYTLGKEMALQGGENPIKAEQLRHIFDMYKGADGVLDPTEPASRIREAYTDNNPNRDLGAANTRDVLKSQGANGVVREGLTRCIGKGLISSKTAANVASFASGAMNVAKFGFGAATVVNGVLALRHSGAAIVKSIFGGDSKASWGKARAATKRGAKFGLTYEGIKFLQKPNQYRENSLIRDVWALFDPDLATKISQEQQINSKELISVYTKQRALTNTIGTLSAGQLVARGILNAGNGTDKIAIDMDKFVQEFPVMERELQKEGGRPAVKGFLKELEQLMVNEYQLTRTKLQALSTNPEPLNTLFGSLDLIRHQVAPMNTLLQKELGRTIDIDMLSNLNDVDRQKYVERMAFVSQQLNKFTNKNLLKSYAFNPPTDYNKVWVSMRLALDGPASKDTSLPIDGVKDGLKKFLDGTITEQKYFEGLRQVFADNTQLPLEAPDPADPTKKIKVPLYVSPAPAGVTADFTTFLHDPKIGNSPDPTGIITPGATEYIANPTLGATAFSAPSATPFDPTTQSWSTDLYK